MFLKLLYTQARTYTHTLCTNRLSQLFSSYSLFDDSGAQWMLRKIKELPLGLFHGDISWFLQKGDFDSLPPS